MKAGVILLPKRVLEVLRHERLVRLPNETGGFLLGMRRALHIEIAHATLQAEQDQATPYTFERQDGQHRRAAVSAWEKAGGEVGLIGDWHTHPAGPAAPSQMDRRAWKTLTSSIRQEAVGLILAEENALGVFIAPRGWSLSGARRCSLVEETPEDLIFAKGAAERTRT